MWFGRAKLLQVCEGLRILGGWPRRREGLKMSELGKWLKKQVRKYDAGKLPAKYRHILEVLGREGVWGQQKMQKVQINDINTSKRLQ